MHELNQALKRVLNDVSVQIQLGIDLQFPTRQALPTGIIQPRRSDTNPKILRSCPP